MAKFRAGQRVRIIHTTHGENTGKEATIIGHGYAEVVGLGNIYCYDLDIDAVGRSHPLGGQVSVPGDWIEPLTPPHEACDPEFAESIRRLTDSASA